MNICSYRRTKKGGNVHIKKTRQILKALSDDTRLRIVNLLSKEGLTVTDICRVLDRNQSIVSKHLTRMRLVGIVSDRRKGLNVHYSLAQPKDKVHEKLISTVIACLLELKVAKNDLKNLKKLKKRGA